MTVEIEYDEEQDDEINYMQISWKLREAYEKTDASKTGFVNVNDLKMLLTELDIQIPEDIVEEAIMAADVNEDETNIHFYVSLSVRPSRRDTSLTPTSITTHAYRNSLVHC